MTLRGSFVTLLAVSALSASCGGEGDHPTVLPAGEGAGRFPQGGGPVPTRPEDVRPFRDAARFDVVRSAERPMAPIAGGTLTMLRDDDTAVAADPDGDRVFVVNLRAVTVRAVALQPGDEPGRVVEGADGVAYVALRRAGAVVAIDARAATVTARRDVCAAPRGVAYDAARGALHVACAGGELVTFGDGLDAAPTRTVTLDDDLRDVLVVPTGLAVSRFRRAELLLVNDAGEVTRRLSPTMPTTGLEAAVAWRTTLAPDGVVLMSHQVAQTTEVSTAPGGYGGGRTRGVCEPGLVHGAVTSFDLRAGASAVTVMLSGGEMPVDVALTEEGRVLAVASPARALWANATQVVRQPRGAQSCVGFPGRMAPEGQVVSVASFGAGELLLQTRVPLTLFVPGQGRVIALDMTAQGDTGHDLFHTSGFAGIACASCHPEGGDDGRTWRFAGTGPRRTPDLHGGILATAPFHWDGDMRDFTSIAHDVMGGRMLGGVLTDAQVTSMGRWVDGLPARPVAAMGDAASRGRALFDDARVGCATCHGDAAVNRGLAANVGTGGTFQVPSLRGLRWRAPYMHNGCAATIAQRFDPRCGGAQHGDVSALSDAQRDDLVAYLTTL